MMRSGSCRRWKASFEVMACSTPAIALLRTRRRPGGDQDIAGGDGSAVGLEQDRVAVAQHGARGEELDAGVSSVAFVDSLEAGDLLILVGDQRRPVEAHAGGRPAEADRILEGVGEAAGIDQQLLRHAAADDAGAADPVLLGHRHLGAMAGGNPRRPHAARAGADDEEVVVVGGHDGTRFPIAAARSRAASGRRRFP